MSPPRIAITMGDPAGIGPEIILKAVLQLRERIQTGALELVVIGCAATYRATAAALALGQPISDVRPKGSGCGSSGLCFIDVGSGRAIPHGVVCKDAGQAAYAAIREAVDLAMGGDIDAMCTAPLNKEALNLAGHEYGGHTELLADLTGARDSVMMLAHGNMRVSHVSTHTALKQVPAKLTPQRLRRVVELTAQALRQLGIDSPRIAVAALNPHGGEGGLFGTEDQQITAPTLASLRAEGYDCEGPVPGDTVFVKLRAEQYDAVVAMYHDQGHIPVKLLGFHIDPRTGQWNSLSGVNVTLGLPIVRTSVDHGTAFDIAGRGVARCESLLEAIDFGIRMARPGVERHALAHA